MAVQRSPGYEEQSVAAFADGIFGHLTLHAAPTTGRLGVRTTRPPVLALSEAAATPVVAVVGEDHELVAADRAKARVPVRTRREHTPVDWQRCFRMWRTLG